MSSSESSRKSRSTFQKFKQQELTAWRPIVTPGSVLCITIPIALLFVFFGAQLLDQSTKGFELIQTYDDGSGESRVVDGVTNDCSIKFENQGYEDLVNGNRRECSVSFVFPENVAEDQELFLYYEVDSVFQNHRSYIISTNLDQLLNAKEFEDIESARADVELDCQPDVSLTSNATLEQVKFPCGLIAQSYFNDAFQLKSLEREGVVEIEFINTLPQNSALAGVPVTMSINRDDVAFKSDLDDLFRNPTNDKNYPRFDVFEYIWQAYDQFSCYSPANPEVRLDCVNWVDFANEKQPDQGFEENEVFGVGCARCVNDGEILVDEGGIRQPDNFNEATSKFGFRDENFVTWMRTATFPTFRNLHGRLTLEVNEGSSTEGVEASDLSFKANDILTIDIVPNFLVSEFGGQKRLVLSTFSPSQTNLRAIGLAYLWLGIVCLAVSCLILLKRFVAPRTLGNPDHVHEKKE